MIYHRYCKGEHGGLSARSYDYTD